MTKRWLFLCIGLILAIAQHHDTKRVNANLYASSIELASTASLPSREARSSGFLTPLTWPSSPHIRVQNLKPGVSTRTLAAIRVAQKTELILAVLMPEHQTEQLQKWQPTATYLSQAVPDYSFSIVGMDAQTLETAIAQSAIDFIVTEPGLYVSVASQYDVNRLATRRTVINQEAYAVFGGAIFSQRNRDDIETLQDLANKTFVGVDEQSLEGWQIAWRELADHGVDPYQDLQALNFLHDEANVIAAVQAGHADAGIVRADTMEKLLQTGVVRWTDFKILNQHRRSDIPIPISTRLYPEWPFAALSHIPHDLTQQVTVALLSIESDSSAAQSLSIAGWSIPLTYQPINDLFKQLRITPHQRVDVFNLRAILWHYKRWILTAIILLIMGATTIYVQRREITKRKRSEIELQCSQAELTQRKVELERTLAKLQNTQTQLIQTEKMSSLGQLMAGIAHEINNPVNFIHGNINYANQYVRDLLKLLEAYQAAYPETSHAIQTLARDIDVDFVATDLPKLLQSMKVGSERIREIVQSLRIFSRLDEADLKAVDIHQGIDSTLLILQNRLKEKNNRPAIDIVKQYADLPTVECHAGQLNQVFMNILSNAVDALDEVAYSPTNSDYKHRSNCSTIATCKAPSIWITTKIMNKDWARISFKNNGPSISPEVQHKLFNPFFTTKPVGKGTGLGMSISYQIVAEKHGGHLTCISEPGEGVEFVIQIPIKGKRKTSQNENERAHCQTSSSPLGNSRNKR